MTDVGTRVFPLRPYGNSRGERVDYVVLTPQPETSDTVGAAWAYAVRYTAKGLDLPDHDAAVELLKKRHPSWKVLQTNVVPIAVDLRKADEDVAEGEESVSE